MTIVTSLRRTLLATAASMVVLASVAPAGQTKVDVSGTWVFEVQTDAGGGTPTMTFKQDGEKITGHYTGTFGEAELTGTVKGNDISFSFTADFQGNALTSAYKGTLDGAASMKGTLEISGLGSGTFTAKKK